MQKVLLDDVGEVLELMAKAEAAVGDFYRACAGQWEQDRDFWLTLAAEEDGHYATVERTLSLYEAHPDRFTLRRSFDPEAYRSLVDWLKSSTEEIAGGGASRSQALATALDIEKTILESQVKDLVETREREYLDLIDLLFEQTGRHTLMLQAKASGSVK